MTATDKLRRSLDEHDVDWSSEVLADCLIVTMWTDGETAYEFNELINSNHAYLEMNINPCTPGEAIAAWNTRVTHGTLTAEHVKWIHEIIEKHWHDLPAEYDMLEATALPEYSYDWQAIADELNATLGEPKRAVCSECGTLLSDYILCTPCFEKLAVKR